MMRQITRLIQNGWVITEIRFDKWQNFYYLGASHESGEASASSAGQTMGEAINNLCSDANAKTPAWYLAQLKAA